MAGAIQLLRGGQAGRTGTNHGHAFAASHQRRFGANPTFAESVLDDSLLDHFNGDRRFIDPQYAGSFTGCGTHAPGELRKIIGGMQHADSFAPAVAIDQIVPVRNHVVQWTAGMTERNAAIHAARALGTDFIVRKFLIDLEPVVYSLYYGASGRSFAWMLQKACCFTHVRPPLVGLGAGGCGLGAAPPLAAFLERVCTRAGTPSRISGAFRASAPGSICRGGCPWFPRVERSSHGPPAGRPDRKSAPDRRSICCRAHSKTRRPHPAR